jgi:hypothetical protein
MFAAMNDGYAARLDGLEFQQDRKMMVRTFLVRFSAIFSLNQDLLLEQHYFNDNVMLGSDGKWDSWLIPGMRPQMNSLEPLQPKATGTWVPDGGAFNIPRRAQCIYKLHGSSNWRDRANGSLLIIGGDKAAGIQSHEILSRYSQEFKRQLSQPGARLMVIGYGFRDPHINEVIAAAVEGGLKFFLIDPAGSGLARSLNGTRQAGAIPATTSLESVFETALIGASRRSLSEIFGADRIEHAKVMQFFST